MMQMMQQYNRPMMRAPMQQGIYQSSPMAYRAPMQTANLSRVAPSVEVQQRLAAEEAARRAAASGGDGGSSVYENIHSEGGA